MTIVKTIPYVRQGIDIEARIIQNPEGKFSWELSHVCKISPNSAIHHAVGIWEKDIVQVQNHLDQHLEKFKNATSIERNPDY